MDFFFSLAAEKECLSGEFRCVFGVKTEETGLRGKEKEDGGVGRKGEKEEEGGKGEQFCIGFFLKCDGEEHCVNGTDEIDCDWSKFGNLNGNWKKKQKFAYSQD